MTDLKEGKRLLASYLEARESDTGSGGGSVEGFNAHQAWKARWQDWCIKNGEALLLSSLKLRLLCQHSRQDRDGKTRRLVCLDCATPISERTL